MSDQPSLFDAPPASTPVTDPVEERVLGLVEQIIRDRYTLTLEDALVHPDRAFYEERIAAYTQEVKRLRSVG